MFVQLLLAHLLGDFILQPTSWVAHKERNKLRSKYLYLHTLIHFLLVFLFLWNLNQWWIALLVAGTHFIIDWAKLQFQNSSTKRAWFFIDQLLHLSVLASISIFFEAYINWNYIFNQEHLKFAAGLLFVSYPASILVKTLIGAYTPEEDSTDKSNDSLQNAGKYIGILERILVFIFIYVNHWEGVGFMIAAKSVFRFSDLAQAKQRKLTEYVLIGTLLSFGLAILTGVVVKM